MRVRLVVWTFAALAVVGLFFAPATTKIGLPKTILLVLAVGVCVGRLITDLITSAEQGETLAKEASDFWEAMIGAGIVGSCWLLTPLIILLPLNVLDRMEIPTLISSCGLARVMLSFNHWNLMVIALLGAFFPVKTFIVRLFWRVTLTSG